MTPPPPADRHDPYAPFRGSCRSCDTRIVWADTTTGKRMPVDGQPTDDGNVQLTIIPAAAGKPARLVAGVLNRCQAIGAHALGEQLYQSHFTSCPDAARHRRSRSKTRRWRES